MTLADVTADAVRAAIEEFDRLGRDEFLQANGFGRSRTYFLDYGGQRYDSKAIVGYAHGISGQTQLRAAEFSGGEQTVANLLRRLGFAVCRVKNPDWTRDEIIVACALVEANGWKQLGDEDPRVGDLSRLLQSAAIHPIDSRGPNFRNHAGVARKTADIATRHPDYKGKPTNGNRLDQEVLHDFLARPEEMRALAVAIRATLRATDSMDPGPVPDPDLDDVSADEGEVLRRAHLRRERDPNLRKRKLADAKRRGQSIACEACHFDFGWTYGDHGVDYIECHHRVPLHVTGQTKTYLKDLVLICANCHRMIHRRREWLTFEQLVEMIERQRARNVQ